MRKIVMLQGGIGKQLCALPALRKAQSMGDDIWLITPYPHIFSNEGFRVYVPNVPYLFEDVISKGRYYSEDPYNLFEYYNDKVHLVQAYNIIINSDDSWLSPSPVTLTLEEMDWARQAVASCRRSNGLKIGYEVGGAGLRVFEGNWEDLTNRSLKKEMASFLPVRYSCHNWFNVSHVGLKHWATACDQNDKPMRTGLVECPVPEGDVRKLISFIAAMDAIVTCDSSALHIAAAFGKPHVAIFGGTDPRQLAYPDSKVVTKKSHVLEQGPWGHNPGTKVEFNRGAMDFENDDTESLYAAIDSMIKLFPKGS